MADLPGQFSCENFTPFFDIFLRIYLARNVPNISRKWFVTQLLLNTYIFFWEVLLKNTFSSNPLEGELRLALRRDLKHPQRRVCQLCIRAFSLCLYYNCVLVSRSRSVSFYVKSLFILSQVLAKNLTKTQYASFRRKTRVSR